jgi:hypothetical protein
LLDHIGHGSRYLRLSWLSVVDAGATGIGEAEEEAGGDGLGPVVDVEAGDGLVDERRFDPEAVAAVNAAAAIAREEDAARHEL